MAIIRADILENLWLALGTLRANKLRSFLTIIGVIIGVVGPRPFNVGNLSRRQLARAS